MNKWTQKLSHQAYFRSCPRLLDLICLGVGLSQLMPLDFWFEMLETQGFPLGLDKFDKQHFSGESYCWYARQNLTRTFLQVHWLSQTALEPGFIGESLGTLRTHPHLKVFLLPVHGNRKGKPSSTGSAIPAYTAESSASLIK